MSSTRQISMLLPVYNEGCFLRYSLEHPIKYIDEVVIIDGSPWGSSTDNTQKIIDKFDSLYPGKIKYLSGTFIRDDGSWDESAQRNLGLSHISGDILMPHCGDMIYTEADFCKMLQSINKFPSKKIIYCIFIEFWLDVYHIRLYGGHVMEAWYPVPAISDVPFCAMDIVDCYEGGPNLSLKNYNTNDFLFVPNAFRYHYGWISGFDKQVKKHIRNMTMGAWKGSDIDIIPKEEVNIAAWAINHVLSYPQQNCSFDFCGEQPLTITPSYKDNYDETIKYYENKFGEGFYL